MVERIVHSLTQEIQLSPISPCSSLPPLLAHTQLTLILECSVVNPVSSFTPDKLNEASSACRKLFFNTRLGTLCRPEFMLKGDGLASTYAQAERLSIDYWGRLNEVLTGVSLMKLSFIVSKKLPMTVFDVLTGATARINNGSISSHYVHSSSTSSSTSTKEDESQSRRRRRRDEIDPKIRG